MIKLHRAVYVSEAVGDTARDISVLAEILGGSRKNNPARGMSGLLLAHDDAFLQVLEGQASDIERLLERLKRDDRHRNLKLLSFEPIAARAFGEWSMGHARITPRIAGTLPTSRLADISGPVALRLLLDCAAELKADA